MVDDSRELGTDRPPRPRRSDRWRTSEPLTSAARPGAVSGNGAGTAGEVATPTAGLPARRNLAVAIASGVVLAAAFVATLLWHPAAFTALVGVLCLLAYIELATVLADRGLAVDVPVLVVGTAVMLAGTYEAGLAGQVVGVAVLFVAAVVWQLGDRHRHDALRTVSRVLFFGLWIGFSATYAVLLVARPTDGPVAVLAVIGSVVVADIAAYAVGTRIGRHKVAPTISPGKSWEGLVGGLVAAAALAALVLPRLGPLFQPHTAAGVAALAGVAGFLGDLTESMVKRDLGVKDLGALMPGHGGVLDRVDSILLALPVGYYAIELLA